MEAQIVAEAGKSKAVTIATNMAGRGTDIQLGGNKNSEKVEKSLFEKIVGRISFFVNSGMRFVTETAKMAWFTELWKKRYFRHT